MFQDAPLWCGSFPIPPTLKTAFLLGTLWDSTFGKAPQQPSPGASLVHQSARQTSQLCQPHAMVQQAFDIAG